MSADFRFYQPHILAYLKEGQTIDGEVIPASEWFCQAVTKAYCTIAEGFGCEVFTSERRLNEAHALWVDDLVRMRIDGESQPDHFKHAGALAYWLRRRVV